MAEAVGPVGREVDVEDEVVHRGDGSAQRRPGRGGAGREDEDPVIAFVVRPRAFAAAGEPELHLRAEHPSLITPPMSRGVSVIPAAGSVVLSGAKQTRPPGSGTLGAPQTTRCSTPPRSTVTRRSFALGVRLDLHHRGDDDVRCARAVLAHRIDRDARAGEPLGELSGRQFQAGRRALSQ